MERKSGAMFKLNANALPFHPVYTDEHALFLTFSNGFPLSEAQIRRYFNGYYEPYVEAVNVHKPRAGCGPSLFGKIVFKRRLIPEFLMGNNEKIFFIVEDRHLFCRRFVTQKSKPAATASTSHPDGGNHSGGDE